MSNTQAALKLLDRANGRDCFAARIDLASEIVSGLIKTTDKLIDLDPILAHGDCRKQLCEALDALELARDNLVLLLRKDHYQAETLLMKKK